jgi:RNA polymerase sigma factor (sigma-70 family)
MAQRPQTRNPGQDPKRDEGIFMIRRVNRCTQIPAGGFVIHLRNFIDLGPLWIHTSSLNLFPRLAFHCTMQHTVASSTAQAGLVCTVKESTPKRSVEPFPQESAGVLIAAVEAAKAGDPEAWTVLRQRYQLPLYAFVCELVRNPETALDLVQETLINAIRYLPTLRENKRFGSWLFSIAHQKCTHHWRRPNPSEPGEEPDLEDQPDQGLNPREWLIAQEQEQAFLAGLQKLAEPHREVVLLHCLEEFSLEEIAQLTQTPLGTVKSRLHYARRSLRTAMENRS